MLHDVLRKPNRQENRWLISAQTFSKELGRGLRTPKSRAKIFQIRRLQSVSVFSILNHPCSVMVYYYLFAFFFFS